MSKTQKFSLSGHHGQFEKGQIFFRQKIPKTGKSAKKFNSIC